MTTPAGRMVSLLTPGEVAALFGVRRATVVRWAAAGRIPSVRTPTGAYRFPDEIDEVLTAGTTEVSR